ncbi:MAG: ABC transporter permease [Acidobacteria bacterium]|nr:ABC transporter permease [Acidobacteriota bacterium]
MSSRSSRTFLHTNLNQTLRSLAKTPGFTATVILTLALGIGANTAIFTLLDQLLLRPLPVPNPQELVTFDDKGTFIGWTHNDATFSYPVYRDLAQGSNGVLAGLVGRLPVTVNVTVGSSPERVDGDLLSGNAWQTLGLTPHWGRFYGPEDDVTPLAHPVAVISHGYFVRRFGGNEQALAKPILVNGHPFTILGVAPRGFTGLETGVLPDIYLPLTMKAWATPTWDQLEDRKTRWVSMMGRLAPGVPLEKATAALNVLYKQIHERDVALWADADAEFRAKFVKKVLLVAPGALGRSELRNRMKTPLLVLMGLVALVLLIACANVANLLLARAATRQRDMAVRLAMGASRRQIVEPLLVESLVLALSGGALGLLVASLLGDAIVRIFPEGSSLANLATRPDLRVALVAFGVSAFTALAFGLFPALQASDSSLIEPLREGAGSVSLSRGAVRARRALVVAQVALSLLLLVGAGLFARSLSSLATMDPGFRTADVASFAIDPSLNGHGRAETAAILGRVREAVSTVPGVVSTSAAGIALLSGNDWRSTTTVVGHEARKGEDRNPSVNAIAPEFFETLGIPLLLGRGFTASDSFEAPKVAVVNEAFVKMYCDGAHPLGRTLHFGRKEDPDKELIQIVGVARDLKYMGLREPARPFIYLPLLQQKELDQATIYVRTAKDAKALLPAIREAARGVASDLPIFEVRTMRVQVEGSLTAERVVAFLCSGFGVLATLLAAIGLYGVVAFLVARRTREFGIRLALGETRISVLRLVLRDAGGMAGLGILVGLPLSLAAGKLVESQLYGVSSHDVVVLALASATLSIAALGAGTVAALRATRVSPAVALRQE